MLAVIVASLFAIFISALSVITPTEDLLNYQEQFLNQGGEFEVGYSLISFIFSFLGFPFWIYLTIFNLFVFVGFSTLFNCFKEDLRNQILFFWFVAFLILVGDNFGAVILRTAISTLLLNFSLFKCARRELIIGIILFILAVSFHTLAIVFLPLFLFVNFRSCAFEITVILVSFLLIGFRIAEPFWLFDFFIFSLELFQSDYLVRYQSTRFFATDFRVSTTFFLLPPIVFLLIYLRKSNNFDFKSNVLSKALSFSFLIYAFLPFLIAQRIFSFMSPLFVIAIWYCTYKVGRRLSLIVALVFICLVVNQNLVYWERYYS